VLDLLIGYPDPICQVGLGEAAFDAPKSHALANCFVLTIRSLREMFVTFLGPHWDDPT